MTPCPACGGLLVDALGDCVRCRVDPACTAGTFSSFRTDAFDAMHYAFSSARRAGKSAASAPVEVIDAPKVRNPEKAKYLARVRAQRPIAVVRKGAA